MNPIYEKTKQYILTAHPEWANQVKWVYGVKGSTSFYGGHGYNCAIPTTITIENETWYLENSMSIWHDNSSRVESNRCQVKIYSNGSASGFGSAFFIEHSTANYDYGWRTNGVTNVYRNIDT